MREDQSPIVDISDPLIRQFLEVAHVKQFLTLVTKIPESMPEDSQELGL
jgi:hypothetical protein